MVYSSTKRRRTMGAGRTTRQIYTTHDIPTSLCVQGCLSQETSSITAHSLLLLILLVAVFVASFLLFCLLRVAFYHFVPYALVGRIHRFWLGDVFACLALPRHCVLDLLGPCSSSWPSTAHLITCVGFRARGHVAPAHYRIDKAHNRICWFYSFMMNGYFLFYFHYEVLCYIAPCWYKT